LACAAREKKPNRTEAPKRRRDVMRRLTGPIAAALVVGAVLLAVSACGGGGGGGGEAAGTATATGASTAAVGDAGSGKDVFGSQGCGSCHTLAAAGASGSVGPNLDQELADSAQQAGEPLEEFTRESIVDPNKFVAKGFAPNVMPGNFGDTLSDQQLDDLVAFVVKSVSS
jgi:mono/diheme cytochrome c family protein